MGRLFGRVGREVWERRGDFFRNLFEVYWNICGIFEFILGFFYRTDSEFVLIYGNCLILNAYRYMLIFDRFFMNYESVLKY
jgi:hypothetical protein